MTTTTPIAQTPSATSAVAQPAQAQQGSAGLGGLGGTQFLQLLVAQIKNQNPLSPVSSSQFMSQTAELSTLEQITTLSQETKSILATEGFSAGLSAVGKTVSGTDTSGQVVTGKVSSVSLGTSGPVLHVGSADIALSGITTIA